MTKHDGYVVLGRKVFAMPILILSWAAAAPAISLIVALSLFGVNGNPGQLREILGTAASAICVPLVAVATWKTARLCLFIGDNDLVIRNPVRTYRVTFDAAVTFTVGGVFRAGGGSIEGLVVRVAGDEIPVVATAYYYGNSRRKVIDACRDAAQRSGASCELDDWNERPIGRKPRRAPT